MKSPDSFVDYNSKKQERRVCKVGRYVREGAAGEAVPSVPGGDDEWVLHTTNRRYKPSIARAGLAGAWSFVHGDSCPAAACACGRVHSEPSYEGGGRL